MSNWTPEDEKQLAELEAMFKPKGGPQPTRIESHLVEGPLPGPSMVDLASIDATGHESQVHDDARLREFKLRLQTEPEFANRVIEETMTRDQLRAQREELRKTNPAKAIELYGHPDALSGKVPKQGEIPARVQLGDRGALSKLAELGDKEAIALIEERRRQARGLGAVAGAGTGLALSALGPEAGVIGRIAQGAASGLVEGGVEGAVDQLPPVDIAKQAASRAAIAAALEVALLGVGGLARQQIRSLRDPTKGGTRQVPDDIARRAELLNSAEASGYETSMTPAGIQPRLADKPGDVVGPVITPSGVSQMTDDVSKRVYKGALGIDREATKAKDAADALVESLAGKDKKSVEEVVNRLKADIESQRNITGSGRVDVNAPMDAMEAQAKNLMDERGAISVDPKELETRIANAERKAKVDAFHTDVYGKVSGELKKVRNPEVSAAKEKAAKSIDEAQTVKQTLGINEADSKALLKGKEISDENLDPNALQAVRDRLTNLNSDGKLALNKAIERLSVSDPELAQEVQKLRGALSAKELMNMSKDGARVSSRVTKGGISPYVANIGLGKIRRDPAWRFLEKALKVAGPGASGATSAPVSDKIPEQMTSLKGRGEVKQKAWKATPEQEAQIRAYILGGLR